jgi:hypothetical protein
MLIAVSRTCCCVWGSTTLEREGITANGASSQGSSMNSCPAPTPDLQSRHARLDHVTCQQGRVAYKIIRSHPCSSSQAVPDLAQ